MSSYAVNKIVGLGIPFLILCLGLSLTTENDPQLWWVLIVITHTLAYAHFLLGFWYQRQSLKRKNKPKHTKAFYLLTTIAVVVSLIFIAFEATALLAIFAVLYFVLHGTLNEHTLMKQSFEHAPEAKYILPFVFFVTPLFLLSLTHPSFFFTPRLEFLNPTPEIAINLLDNIVSIDAILLVSLFFFGVYLFLVPLRLIANKFYLSGLLVLIVMVTTITIFYLDQPLNYIFLYFIALSYHFISWSFHFLQQFIAHNPARIKSYLWHHVYVLAPLILITFLLLFDIPNMKEVHWILFDGKVFLILAMVHNTTSLINEEWFDNWLKKSIV